jgi:hypothetical protein
MSCPYRNTSILQVFSGLPVFELLTSNVSLPSIQCAAARDHDFIVDTAVNFVDGEGANFHLREADDVVHTERAAQVVCQLSQVEFRHADGMVAI